MATSPRDSLTAIVGPLEASVSASTPEILIHVYCVKYESASTTGWSSSQSHGIQVLNGVPEGGTLFEIALHQTIVACGKVRQIIQVTYHVINSHE